jgi:aminoglycoside phosphotransferase (APT) family kinase protein
MSESSLDQRIAQYLSRRLGADVRIVDLGRSTEGFSQETFMVDVEGDTSERRGFVIKREPVAGLLEPYDLEPEFRVLHALSDHPLASPRTPFFESDPQVLERPFYVMERLPGDVVVPAPGPDGEPPFSDAERASLAPQVIHALAELHAVDWRKLGLEFLDPPAPGRGAAERELARWQERIGRTGLAVAPMVGDALHWLQANVPETDEVTLVHGDYRLGNFLIENGSLTGILDWELVHLGDPLEDLAWCISELWRARTGLAGAMLPEEEFVAAYAAAAGREADPARLRFYAILSLIKMIAIMLTGIRAFNDGRTRDLRMAIFDHQLPFLYALLAVERGWLPRGM